MKTPMTAIRTESRGDLLITRDMRVFSRTLGVSGACDVLEFRRGGTGSPPHWAGEGLWQPFPVEYKRGRPKEHDADALQLCGPGHVPGGDALL